jgi:hypothetical protein
MTPDALKVALLTSTGAGPDCSMATFTQPDGRKVAFLQPDGTVAAG